MSKNQLKAKTLTASIMLALTFAGAAYTPSAAEAAYTVRCINCVTQGQANEVIGNTNRANQLLQNLIDKVEKTRTDIVNAIGKSTTTVGTAVSQSGEILAHDRAQNDQFGEIMDVVRTREGDINCGNVGAGSAPSTTTQKGGGGGGGSGGGSYSGSSSDTLNKAQTAAGITNKIPKLEEIPPPDAQAGLTGRGLCEAYASPTSVRGQICSRSGAKTGGSAFPEADISGLTLLIGPQKPTDANKVKRNSFAPDSEEHDAMMASMGLLFANEAPPVLSKAQADTASGDSFLGMLMRWLANQDLSKQIAQNRIDSFLTDERTKTALDEISIEDSAFLNDYLKDIKGWKENGVSTALMRDIQVDRRASNPKWTLDVSSMKEDELPREALYIAAEQLKLTRDIYEEISTANLLLAKLLESNGEALMEKIKVLEINAATESAYKDGAAKP